MPYRREKGEAEIERGKEGGCKSMTRGGRGREAGLGAVSANAAAAGNPVFVRSKN